MAWLCLLRQATLHIGAFWDFGIIMSSENLVCLFVSLCRWQIRKYDEVCMQYYKKEAVEWLCLKSQDTSTLLVEINLDILILSC